MSMKYERDSNHYSQTMVVQMYLTENRTESCSDGSNNNRHVNAMSSQEDLPNIAPATLANNIFHSITAQNESLLKNLNVDINQCTPYWNMELEYSGEWEETCAIFDAIRKCDPMMNAITICRMNTRQSIPCANLLKTAISVESVHLRVDNEVQTLGLAAIIHSLIENKSIKIIVVCQQADVTSDNHFEKIMNEIVPTQDDLKKLGTLFGTAIQLNITIQEIKVVNCRFTNDVFFEPFVQQSIRTKACTLINLIISNCNIGDTVAIAVAQALYWNQNLKHLCISTNKVTDIGATSIAAAIRYNNVLIKLDLRNNPIHDDGISSLINSLRYNTVLESLCLHNIEVSEKVCNMLAYQIATDGDIKELNCNHFLLFNSTLKNLHTANHFSPRYNSLHHVLKYSSLYRQALATKKGMPERNDKREWLLNVWVENQF